MEGGLRRRPALRDRRPLRARRGIRSGPTRLQRLHPRQRHRERVRGAAGPAHDRGAATDHPAVQLMLSAEQYGPWALVTGGSEGLGAAFAHQLARAGINLILLARREGPLSATAGDIRTKYDVEVR